MFEDDSLGIYRYEVASIINGYRNTIALTNDLEIANNYYNATITKFVNKDCIVFIFDYDKNCNIEYYDSKVEIS